MRTASLRQARRACRDGRSAGIPARGSGCGRTRDRRRLCSPLSRRPVPELPSTRPVKNGRSKAVTAGYTAGLRDAAPRRRGLQHHAVDLRAHGSTHRLPGTTHSTPPHRHPTAPPAEPRTVRTPARSTTRQAYGYAPLVHAGTCVILWWRSWCLSVRERVPLPVPTGGGSLPCASACPKRSNPAKTGWP